MDRFIQVSRNGQRQWVELKDCSGEKGEIPLLDSLDGTPAKNANIATCKDRPQGSLVMIRDSSRKDDVVSKKWVELPDCKGDADEVPLN